MTASGRLRSSRGRCASCVHEGESLADPMIPSAEGERVAGAPAQSLSKKYVYIQGRREGRERKRTENRKRREMVALTGRLEKRE